MVALKMSKERIKEIDSYLKQEHKAGTLNIVEAKSDLRTSGDTIIKRMAANNLRPLGQNQVLLSTVNALNDWLKNNTFTVQGQKYYDNEQFIKEVMRLEDMNETEAIKRASYIVRNVPELNIKNITPLKKGRGKKVKELGEAFDNNTSFKDNYIKKHGNIKIADLTNDQLNTALGTLAKIKRDADIVPKDAITLQEFSKQSGISEANVKALRGTLKDTTRGKEFNRIFPFTVIPNQKTFISKTGLKDKIKQYKDFMDLDVLNDSTIERANKFKNSEVIQKFLNNKDTDLWTKEGRAKALKALGKGTTPYEASYAMSTLARAYNGETLRGINVKPDKAKGEFIWKHLTSLKERDPWSAPVYNEGLRQVDKELKGVGSFRTFKDTYTAKMNEIFDKMGTPKKYRTSINEIVGVKGPYRNQMAPYSAFVDLTRSDLNRYIAGQQSDLSKAMAYLDKYKNDQLKFSNKIKQFNEGLYVKGRGFLKGTNPKRLEGITKKFGQEAADQVRLASLVEGTDVESVYKKADLDRWAKKGLDLRKMSKEKGYFIDVKGARPFFDVTPEDLKKAVAGLGKGKQIKLCNALNKGGLAVRGCADAIDQDPVKFSKIVNESTDTSPAMQKLKTVTTGFLNFAKKGGKYGAIAAAGAVGAGLVKTFMNDDPSTYLSDENQQKNMLIEMVTDPIDETPEESPAILDWQLPTLGAITAAGMVPGGAETYRARRAIRPDKFIGPMEKGVGPVRAALGLKGVLGKGLAATATPLGLAALEPLHIAGQIQQGDSLTDIATNPWNYLGPTFASGLTKEAARFTSPTVSKIMRLGMSPTALRGLSRFGGYGLAASLGIQGLQKFDDWRNKRGWFSEE